MSHNKRAKAAHPQKALDPGLVQQILDDLNAERIEVERDYRAKQTDYQSTTQELATEGARDFTVELEAEIAKRNLTRLRGLLDKGRLSRQDYDAQERQADRALEKAKARANARRRHNTAILQPKQDALKTLQQRRGQLAEDWNHWTRAGRAASLDLAAYWDESKPLPAADDPPAVGDAIADAEAVAEASASLGASLGDEEDE